MHCASGLQREQIKERHVEVWSVSPSSRPLLCTAARISSSQAAGLWSASSACPFYPPVSSLAFLLLQLLPLVSASPAETRNTSGFRWRAGEWDLATACTERTIILNDDYLRRLLLANAGIILTTE